MTGRTAGGVAAGGFVPPTLAAAIALLLAACTWMTLPAPASATPGLKTGIGGPELKSADASFRNRWHRRAKNAKAAFVRIDVAWGAVAPKRPASPASPSDPAYEFTAVDRAVISARARGLRPMLTIYNPPRWATSSGCGGHRPRCKPSPKAFGKLGKAMARRYSGSFGVLPRVKHFEAWNEPNLSLFLAPQWRRGKPASANRYRKLLNAFYRNVKSVRRSNVVIAAGTAPFGEPKGGDRMRPVAFWRHVLCLKPNRKRKCSKRTRFDALAHHAVNPRGGPGRHARHRDDAAIPDLKRIRRVLRAAERRGTAKGKKRHPLWMTEMWWETNPPDKHQGVRPGKQARYIVRTLYEVWRDGARVAVNYQLRDDPYDPANPAATWQAGVYFRSGKAKPGLRAFRFPFLAQRRGKKKVMVWGRSPHKGRLRIQRKRGRGWKTVRKRRVGSREVFKMNVPRKRKANWRAKVAKTKSMSSRAG